MRSGTKFTLSLIGVPALLFTGACAPEAPPPGGQASALWGSGDPPNRNGQYRFERPTPPTRNTDMVEEVGLHIRFVFERSDGSKAAVWQTFHSLAGALKAGDTTKILAEPLKEGTGPNAQEIIAAAFPACVRLLEWTPPAEPPPGARAVLELVLDHSPDRGEDARDMWLDCEIWRAITPDDAQEEWGRDEYLKLFEDAGEPFLDVVRALSPNQSTR